MYYPTSSLILKIRKVSWSEWISDQAFMTHVVRVSHSKASSQGLATAHIWALTWVSTYAGFPYLLSVLQDPLARAYAVASNPVPLREAAPLPLSFVVWLESCMLSSMVLLRID